MSEFEARCASSYYVWEAAGKPLSIHVRLDLIQRLNYSIVRAFKSVPRRGLEIGGLLLGRIEDHDRPSIIVDDVDLIDSEHRRGPSYTLSAADRQRLEGRLAKWKSKPPQAHSVVGYVRSHTRSGLYLDQYDLAVIDSYFPDPLQVFLLVRPAPASTSIAGFFLRENGEINGRVSLLEFPFHLDLLLAGDYRILNPPAEGYEEETEEKPQALQPAALPTPERHHIPSFGQARRVWAPVAAILVLAAVGLGYRKLVKRPAAAPIVSAPVPAARGPSLSLTVERSGNMLRLRWDPGMAAIQKAKHGVLWITDGNQRKRLALDPRQLKIGSLAYWPVAADVDFRLDVISSTRQVSESIRALGAHEPIPQPASRDPATRASIDTGEPVLRPEFGVYARYDDSKPSPFGDAPYAATPAESADRLKAEAPVSQAVAPLNVEPEPTPLRNPQTVVSTISYEAVTPSKFRRVVNRIPLLRRLQKNRYKAGELFVAARPVRQVSPAVPPGFKLAGNVPVDLKVYVDQSGNVRRTELLSEETDGRLGRLVTRAAERWQFHPARLNEQDVSSEVILHFRFRNPSQ